MTDSGLEALVQTTAGTVRGRWRTDFAGNLSASFLGIPFAEAPVGDLRFEAPVPHGPWKGVRDAGEMGATPQRRPYADVTAIPEPSFPGDSTLNLNVFSPSPSRTDQPLPVLVWIHGGGFIAGSPASPWYDGRAFTRDGVVTVNVSYRLGFDGFGWISNAPSNRGIRDWLLALEWVQANIAAFGGDPSRVTIGGQSAGGGAVLALLAMPQAQHLFHRVLAVSPSATAVPAERAEAIARRMAELRDVEVTKQGFSTIADEDLRDLFDRAVDSDSDSYGPADAVAQLRSMASAAPSGPMLDGDLVTQPVVDAIRQGIGRDKALVIGTTDDEFSGALDDMRTKLRFFPARSVLRAMGAPAEVRDRYVRANLDVRARGVAATAGRYLTDVVFRAPSLAIVRARSGAATGSTAGAPTWLYRFAWRSPVTGYAAHCLDVPFWFDCLADTSVPALAGSSTPQALASEMHARAVEFVLSGEAGWPAWNTGSNSDRVFDDPSYTEINGYAGAAPLLPSV